VQDDRDSPGRELHASRRRARRARSAAGRRRRDQVKAFGVIGVIVASLALQMAFARFTVGGRWSLDLVLVAVAFIALKWGPGAGVIGGTIGGLTQDALAGGTIGVGGLAKTIVGFFVGVIGSQFIV